MFKITIKSQKQGEFWLTKETQEEVEQYKTWCAETAHWGMPLWVEEVPEQVELEIIDGVEVIKTTPAFQIVHPAEYEIIVEDMTEQIAAEQAQINAVKAAQQNAAIRLFSFPQQVDACGDLDALKNAIKQMVSDIAILLTKEK
jgi:hypothetical protein